MDIIGPWVSECCVLQVNARESASKLYESYTAWCVKNGERAMSQRMFGARLTERGFERRKGMLGSGGLIGYWGIGLLDDKGRKG